jgi:hypothetical protein
LSPSTHGVTMVLYPFAPAISGDLSATVTGSFAPRLLPVKFQLGLRPCFTPPFMAVVNSRSRDACFRKIPCIPGDTLPSEDDLLPSDDDTW